jgi:hypothetical protein
MNEIIWFFIGLGFGMVIMLTRKRDKEIKSYEQLDEELRKDLALNKNLVDSLKKDLAFYKDRLYTLQGKKNGNS